MIRFELENIVIKIADKVLDQMLQFKQNTDDKSESGGILLGYYIDDSTFTITDITTPTNFDKSSRYNFLRTKLSAQKAINKLFKESSGKKIYLGEWHTHPEDIPSPSQIDKKSIKEQFRLNKLNSSVIFMIIIGNSGLNISSVKAEEITSHKIIRYNEMEN